MANVSRGVSAALVFVQIIGFIFLMGMVWALGHDLLFGAVSAGFSLSIADSPGVFRLLSMIYVSAVVLIALGLGLSGINAVNRGGS